MYVNSVDILTCVQVYCLSLVSVWHLESRLELCCCSDYSTAFVGTWRHRHWLSQLRKPRTATIIQLSSGRVI